MVSRLTQLSVIEVILIKKIKPCKMALIKAELKHKLKAESGRFV